MRHGHINKKSEITVRVFGYPNSKTERRLCMEWNIVADSGCDLRGIKLGDKKIKITKIPFSIFVENIEYMDNPRFNVGDMLHRIESRISIPTQPVRLRRLGKRPLTREIIFLPLPCHPRCPAVTTVPRWQQLWSRKKIQRKKSIFLTPVLPDPDRRCWLSVRRN